MNIPSSPRWGIFCRRWRKRKSFMRTFRMDSKRRSSWGRFRLRQHPEAGQDLRFARFGGHFGNLPLSTHAPTIKTGMLRSLLLTRDENTARIEGLVQLRDADEA